ncbi:hypothetical protein [Streptomyces sp. CFMR 7]|uniref:hypothetical protein n=1 Tax=Streptomyces sp. CFMR 7 TaxID=1649184 RepID=UPI0011A7E010|nr:hypothetical protein [Streptomyces sp. CFMR 7]
MDQAVAGLIGTALGGLIGVAGTLGAARLNGRDQRRNQHDHWRRTQRRSAYSHLLSKFSEAMRAGSKALDAYQMGHPSAAALIEQFDELVQSLDEAVSFVDLEGPESASSAARDLAGAMFNWSNGLVLAQAADDGEFTPTVHDASLDVMALLEEKSACYDASDAFIALCRGLLDD